MLPNNNSAPGVNINNGINVNVKDNGNKVVLDKNVNGNKIDKYYSMLIQLIENILKVSPSPNEDIN